MATRHPHDDDCAPTEGLAPRPGDAVATADGTLAAGTRLGRYRIDALLGSGGMGEVYRATQLEPVRREVALKLLRSSRLEARHLAYFEVERQVLAQMRHPAIAQIHDAGATAEGVPYFAMELIEGLPLADYAARARLTIDARIALCLRICEGVQHAHHRGIVHRDLKPGNLLVDTLDGRPSPKIIDFGIATAASLAHGTALERAGTPAYMSPEQASGDPRDVDTRSDVHALGVVLCELLAGVRPTAGIAPSAAYAALPADAAARIAGERGLDPAALRRRMRGDLDWIIAKATAPDREARHASVAALADDLQRSIDGRPVLAAPRSRRYLVGKFVRRHRTAVAAASAVVLALAGGLALSLHGLREARAQRMVAEARSADLERVAAFQQSMLEGIDIETMGVGLSEGLLREVERADAAAAPAFAQALAKAGSGDVARGLVERQLLANAVAAIDRDFVAQPEVAAGLRESVARVYSAIGLYARAATELGRVVAWRAQALGDDAEPTLRARDAQVRALLEAADVDAAEAVLRDALPAALRRPAGDAARTGLELAQAQVVSARGDRRAALALVQAVHRRVAAAAGADSVPALQAQNDLAAIQRNLGELDAARDNMEQVVRMRSAILGPTADDTLSAMGNLAVLRIMSGETAAALELQRSLTAIRIRMLGAEHPVALQARATEATMQVDAGDAASALPLLAEVLAARERVLGHDHPQTIRSRLNLATAHARLDDPAAALPLEESVIEARTRLLGATHPDTLSILVNHAGTLLRAGRARESLALLAEAQPLALRVLGPKHPQAQAALLVAGESWRVLGEPARAVAAFSELLALRRAALGEDHIETRAAAWNLIDVHRESGRAAEAASLEARYIAPLLAREPSMLDEAEARFVANWREGRRPGRRG